LATRQTLKTEGKIVKDKGWREVYNFYKEKSSVFSTLLKEEEKVKLTKIWDEKKQTEPPQKYTEGSLLKTMINAYRLVTDEELKKILKENAGIGTPATRSQIIETLINRNYIIRSGKTLVPTVKGIFLIDNLNGNQITKPDYTALWEQRLEEISQGKETKKRFMADIIAYTKELIEFSDTLKQKNKVRQEVKESMGNNVLGRCPLCGSNVIETKKAYSCSNWKKNGCKFVIWNNIAKKKITPAQAKKLIEGKKVAVKGFTSKTGKKFNAYLVYNKNENKVKFAGFLEKEGK
jgi:DNA topoisomerase-3